MNYQFKKNQKYDDIFSFICIDPAECYMQAKCFLVANQDNFNEKNSALTKQNGNI